MPKANLDWETIRKLDETGRILNIFIFNVNILIRSLCDKSLKMLDDLKELIDSILRFLDQNKLSDTEIAQKVLVINKNILTKLRENNKNKCVSISLLLEMYLIAIVPDFLKKALLHSIIFYL